jgi:hypothetical protein
MRGVHRQFCYMASGIADGRASVQECDITERSEGYERGGA